MGVSAFDLSKPLSTEEEIRLSTAGNFITLAIFRPLDTFRSCTARGRSGCGLTALWKGWPKQALNKAVDDEIFSKNISRVTALVSETFNVKEPSSTPQGKAAVAVLARALTLSVMVPYHALMDPKKRRVAFSKAHGNSSLIPFLPLYAGFEKTLLKESIFTSSYVLSSAYFGIFFGAYRKGISELVVKTFPQTALDEEKKNKYTDVAVASLKNASAGLVASLLSAPVDLVGNKITLSKQVTTATRKALRKGAYNGINTVIVQTLYSTKIHRRILLSLLPQEGVV